jgi:hypothetical protein
MSKKKTKIDPKAQIAARVAPAPRPANVIKKVYKEGSPGMARKLLGVTLTFLKAAVNEPSALITYVVDEQGHSTGEIISVEMKRDTHAVTLRRRNKITRGLLGTSNIGSSARHVRNSYAACNSKGTKPAKKGRSTGKPSTSKKAA